MYAIVFPVSQVGFRLQNLQYHGTALKQTQEEAHQLGLQLTNNGIAVKFTTGILKSGELTQETHGTQLSQRRATVTVRWQVKHKLRLRGRP